MTPLRFLDAGESALVVEFGDTVDPILNDRVLALDSALARRNPDGLRELVPTYRSLMIHYDPLVLPRAVLCDLVRELVATTGAGTAAPGRHWELPCCYDAPHAEDLTQVADLTGLPPDDVIAMHSSVVYRIYMYGFAPAYCYLGGLPQVLAISRRATPRPPHPSGAVMIGGGLAAVATVPMPTGWYVLGRTPEQLYHPRRATPFLLAPGDTLRFTAVTPDQFAALETRARQGHIVAREVPA